MQLTFRRNILLPSSGSKKKFQQDQQVSRWLLLVTCLLTALAEIFSLTLKMEAICSSETSVASQQTTGVTSQKMILFIITAVKTSNPTKITNLRVP
jgi:hypothetical protein